MTRRGVLSTLGGLGVLGAVGAMGAAAVAATPPVPEDAAPPLAENTPLTVDRWRQSWSGPVLVAHRGSGDTYPEHTLEAYQAAVDWGAEAMEISVGITADGVLVCMHDASYDRTTDGTGRLDAQPASVLDGIRVVQPQLGAHWIENAPRVPLLTDVLDRFGGRVVLCLEAKDRTAYGPMMAAVVTRGLQASVMVKAHHTSDVLAIAAAAGYPRFAYLGAPAEVTPANIAALGATLDPVRDVLVIPAGSGRASQPYLPDALVRAAVATGVPVWVFPLHRRVEARHFFALGVRGAVCAGYGWIAGAVDPVRRDSWARRRVAPGELSSTAATAPTWTADGELRLDRQGGPQFVMTGQFCPIPDAAGGYTIDVDVRWSGPPDLSADALSIAFAHTDDRSYEHRGGVGTGYHVLLRAGGELGIYLHRDGRTAGKRLAARSGPALLPGAWTHLTIEVTPESVAVRRGDTGPAIETADRTVRGGHLHLGRTSSSGVGEFRNLVTS